MLKFKSNYFKNRNIIVSKELKIENFVALNRKQEKEGRKKKKQKYKCKLRWKKSVKILMYH
jgi:hypothetical protein